MFAGALVAAQGPINGRLGVAIGSPLPAALISFSIGWTALLVVNLVSRQPLGEIIRLGDQPWWLWIGGLFGAVMVVGAATVVPRIGAAAWIGAVVAGQLSAAILYDHFGAFGQDVRPIGWERIIGVAFLAIGVYLIRR